MNAADSQIIKAFQQHQLKQEAIQTSKQLNQLIQQVQRHRAASMATLAGDQVFEALTWQLESDISTLLKSLAKETPASLLSPEDLQQVQYEWVAIRQHWRQDSDFDNFKIHCHFIELLLRRNQQLAQRFAPANAAPELRALIELTMEKLPNLVELIAQARGLATHCAAIAHNSPDTRSRLRYLADQIEQQFGDSTRTCAHCSYPVFCRLRRHIQGLNPESLADDFIQTLKREFVESGTPNISSASIYQHGCNLISAVSQQLNKALLLLGQTSSPDLTRWIHQQ